MIFFFVSITMQEHGFIFQALPYFRFCLQNQEKSNIFQSTIQIIAIITKLLIPKEC